MLSDQVLWIVVTLFGGLALYGVMYAVVRLPGQALAQRFANAGVLQGRRIEEIVALVGAPSSLSGLPGGKTLRQWMATGYHIALRFDVNGICEGVVHERKV